MSAARTREDAPGREQNPPVVPKVACEPYASARLRLLDRLQAGPVWTLDLRREPERWSANPAQRVAELRDAGHDVRTLRAWRYDKDGRPDQYRDYYALFVNDRPVKPPSLTTWWGLAVREALDNRP